MTRPACIFCARKHLAQAAVLLGEAANGYPQHVWLAIGHMAEASDELVSAFPEMAREIRALRKGLETAPDGAPPALPLMELIERIGKLGQVTISDQTESTKVTTGVIGVHPPATALASLAMGRSPTPLAVGTAPGALPKRSDAGPLLSTAQVVTPEMRKQIASARLGTGAAKAPAEQKPIPPELRARIDEARAKANSGIASCLGCADKAALQAIATQLVTERPRPANYRGRLVIVSTLGNFHPSYSLTNVILEQAHAAALAGYRVILLVQRGCDMALAPPFPPEISVAAVVPPAARGLDEVDHTILKELTGAMMFWASVLSNGLDADEPLHLLTHDLLFIAQFVTYAAALHGVVAETKRLGGGAQPPPDQAVPLFNQLRRARWYHMAHSSVGVRPPIETPSAELLAATFRVATTPVPAATTTQVEPIIQVDPRYWRHTLPEGHTLITLNYADVHHFAQYYRTHDDKPVPTERIKTLLNPRDLRPFLRMSERASLLTTAHGLHLADVTMLFPLSLPRARDKGVVHVLELFGALKKMDLSVRLVIATAHANAVKEQAIATWIKEVAKVNGLEPADVVLTCDAMPETAVHGLPAEDIRSLWQVSNLFVFPTTSEAGSLVLMEAALAGCTLVLNRSLPALADYIPLPDAVWVPWGSIKGPGKPPVGQELDDLAGSVWGHLSGDRTMMLRRRMFRQHGLEGYGKELDGILRPDLLQFTATSGTNFAPAGDGTTFEPTEQIVVMPANAQTGMGQA